MMINKNKIKYLQSENGQKKSEFIANVLEQKIDLLVADGLGK